MTETQEVLQEVARKGLANSFLVMFLLSYVLILSRTVYKEKLSYWKVFIEMTLLVIFSRIIAVLFT